MSNIDDDNGTIYLMADEVIISRNEYEQFRHALSFCNFISALDKPIGAKVRKKITLQKIIDKANSVLDMNKLL